MREELNTLADAVEASPAALERDLVTSICAALAACRPDIGPASRDLTSTDEVLHLTDEVIPGWTISLQGKAVEPNGHWKCTLRQSSSRDNDEFIGRGKGLTVGQAVLAGTLRVAAYQARQSA